MYISSTLNIEYLLYLHVFDIVFKFITAIFSLQCLLFKAFQEDLKFHQKSIDVIQASGRSLCENVLDNPSALKDELDELNKMWEDVCSKSTRKLSSIQEAMKVSVLFPYS